MNYDAIPVFKPYQALTADHLNDLRNFLDHADRLTRRALVGIGVQCGFALNVDAAARIAISKGVAVSSHGWLIAEEAVVCDRVRPYFVPLPSGDDVVPEQVAEARYPFLFPDGSNQIDAWEMLTTDVVVPANEPAPDPLSAAFLADKTVMLFLECTEESLKNCDINDCADRGAELQFVLRRLLVTRTNADAMIVAQAAIAGFATDPATHPSLSLPFLRVEDLGLARNAIHTFPALFARIVQIAARFAGHLPQALRDAYAAYHHLLADMYPLAQFPHGPFPNDYFGNVWGNLAAQPYLAQYFYDYMLDAASAYNEFVHAARRFDGECLADPDRFPKHVLLGDPVAAPHGFVDGVASPADFAAYDPLRASSGFGVRPNPPRRRTPWIRAEASTELGDLRAVFHRLTLLAHAFQLRGMLNEEIRITPSRHDAAPLGTRCIPPYYAFTPQSDLYRVWSPSKTRANLLSNVYAHQFSTRDVNHPYLYRIDGETFHAIAGHVGKDLARVIAELTESKRVLGLDFAIRPVWMGLALANDENGRALDRASRDRAFDAATRLILCRMGDFEVILLTVLAVLFAFLVYILRGVGRQNTLDHARAPTRVVAGGIIGAAGDTGAAQPSTGRATLNAGGAGRELAAADMERLVSMLRVDAIRRPDALSFDAVRLHPEERETLKATSKTLLDRFRITPAAKGEATVAVLPEVETSAVASFYLDVKDDGDGNLFDRVRNKTAELDIGADQVGATERVYNAVALMDATETLMATTSAKSLAEFESDRFEAAYADFSTKLSNYAVTAPVDTDDVNADDASTNLAVADFAPAVSAQTTALSGAGLFGEATRRMKAIFEELTLAGVAQRYPGLEHRAGVSKGNTLVLAYATKRELGELMRRAAPQLDRLTSALQTPTGGGLQTTIANATRELLNAAGPSRDDSLSDFIVLADFCLDSKCCDDDCSDVIPQDQLPRDLFDLSGVGAMGVPPIIPNGLPAGTSGPAIGGARDEIRAILGDIGVGAGLRLHGAGTLTPAQPRPIDPTPTPRPVEPTPNPRPVEPTPTPRPVEPTPTPRPVEPTPTPRPIEPTPNPRPIDPTPTPRPIEPTPNPRPIDPTPTPRPIEPTPTPRPIEPTPTPRPVEPTPNPRPTEPTPNPRPIEPAPTPRPIEPTPSPREQELGILSGQVLGTGGAARTVVTDAHVVATHEESGEVTRIATREGVFKTRLPVGQYTLIAEAPRMNGTPLTVKISADEPVETALRMRRAR